MVFLRFPFKHRVEYIDLSSQSLICGELLSGIVSSYLGTDLFFLHINGHRLSANDHVKNNATVQITFPLPGGKGGFGSMLRAIGAQIEKTTNREACRDLSGRRLRDINEEQRLKKWISKESERESEKRRRRKDRIERLKLKPKHNFVDFEYEKVISELPERIDDALTEGLQKASKRPSDKAEALGAPSTSKKKCKWMDEEFSDSSSSDSDSLRNSDSVDEACSSSSSDPPKVVDEGEASTNGSSSESGEQIESEISARKSNVVRAETDHVASSTSGPSSQAAVSLLVDVNEEPSASTSCTVEVTSAMVDAPLDFSEFNMAAELESIGLERLKKELSERGLKCGGSLKDRAQRLWAVRDLTPEQYPAQYRARK